ncbi:MAG: LysR substrate-binding domain-containing protein [Aquabacterium sp.]
MLAAFVAVAEHSSVSRAAEELGVGKSVLSKRIALLEQALGTTLFSRSTRRIALTPAGEAYLDFARRALLELGAGEERLRAQRSELSGRIRVSASVAWGQRVLAGALAEFLRQHPGIEIELQLGDRLNDLAFERIDLALRWSAQTLPELHAQPVAAVDWVLAATPTYLAGTAVPQRPADLAQHTCLYYWREPSDDLWTLAAAGELQQVRVSSRFHVDNPEAVAEAALAGLGVALLPDFLSARALADARLQAVLPGWTPQTKYGRLVHAVTTPERWRLLRIRALVEFLAGRLGQEVDGLAWGARHKNRPPS